MQKMLPRKESLSATRKLGFGVASIVLLDAFLTYSRLQDVASLSAQQGNGFTALVTELLFPYFGKYSPVIWRVGLAIFFLAMAFLAHLQFKRESQGFAETP